MIALLFSFAVTTAFIPGIFGAASNTAWAVMWLVAPVLLLNCKIGVTPITVLGALFLAYASISLLWSPHGLLELMQLLALASVFVWGLALKDLRNVTIGLSVGLAVSSVIAILQYFKAELLIINFTKFSGLFINSNIYAEVSGMIFILLIINKLWWYIPVTIPGLLVSSRAVVLALGVSLAMFIWHKSKIASIGIVLASWFIALKLSFRDALIDLSSASSINTQSINIRFNIWLDMLQGFNLFGNGIGSFVYLFPYYNKHLDTTVSLAEYAHNDLMQLIFELGIGALPLVMIVGLLLKINHEYRNALVFFIIIGFFGFPLHMPVTAFIVALVAAQLAKLSLGSRVTVNSRGPILLNRMETV